MMADILQTENMNIEQEPNENPLLKIDTSFRTYLNVYTRSFANHVVGGALDYAFDSDFAVRQKLSGILGWGRLYKAITSGDISAEAKELFMKCNQAGPLKYPEVYDTLMKCTARLELNPPIVLVNDDPSKAIYSITSDNIEPSIIITTGLIDMCDAKELRFLIGCECGRLQNNHTVFDFAFTYLNYNKNVFKPAQRTYKSPVSNQLVHTLVEWAKYSDVTVDRAGIICLDDPKEYAQIICGLYEKGYVDFFGRKAEAMHLDKLVEIHEKIKEENEPRKLVIDKGLTAMQKRVIAGLDFISCVTLYNWRSDLSRREVSPRSQQICDIRCNMILGSDVEV